MKWDFHQAFQSPFHGSLGLPIRRLRAKALVSRMPIELLEHNLTKDKNGRIVGKITRRGG